MKRLLVLLALAAGASRADNTPRYYTPLPTHPSYSCPAPHRFPLAATQYVWDKGQSDLNRYHLYTPAWGKPAPPAAAPAPVYSTQPHLATPQCPPPRVGVTAPDVILRYLRGW